MKYLSADDWSDLQEIWDYLVVRDALPDRADAIVVGGAALVTDMAQYAAELYHQGFSEKIVVSGYSVKAVDMVESEAMLLKRVLLANDVAEADIIVDEEAAGLIK